MPSVPQYQRQVSQQGIQAPRIQADVADGSAITQAANDVATASNRIYLQQREQADTTALINADNQLTTWQNDALFNQQTGAFTLKGKNALNVTQNTLSAFDQQAQEISKSLNDDRQRARFAQVVQRRKDSLSQDLNRYEYQQHQSYMDDVDNASVRLSIDSAALNFNDPTSVGQYRDKAMAVIDSRAQRLGWSPEETQLQKLNASSKLLTGVVGRMAEANPHAAQKYLDGAREGMTADDQLRVGNAIQREIKQREAEARQRQIEQRQLQAIQRMELRTRVEDANAAALNGYTPTDTPSYVDFKNSYEHEEQARAAWNSFQKVQAVAPVAQEMKNAPASEWPALIQQFDKTRGDTAGPGFKEDLELQQHVQRMAGAITKARAADPAGYVISNNPAIKDAFNEASSTGNWKTYITRSVAEQRRLGIEQPTILPRPQADALSAKLKTGAPQEQAKLLTDLSNQFGDYYQDVVKQVGEDAPVQALAGLIGSANQSIETQRSGVFTKGLSRSPQFIQDTLLNGQKALEEKVYKLPPSSSTNGQLINGPDKAFYDAVNGVLDPVSMKQMKANYDAYYAGLAISKGKYGESYDSSISQEAIRALGIEPVSVGAGKTIAPYGMDHNTFKDQISQRYGEYLQQNREAPSLDSLSIYPVGKDTYLLRDQLGNRITTLKVQQ